MRPVADDLSKCQTLTITPLDILNGGFRAVDDIGFPYGRNGVIEEEVLFLEQLKFLFIEVAFENLLRIGCGRLRRVDTVRCSNNSSGVVLLVEMFTHVRCR